MASICCSPPDRVPATAPDAPSGGETGRRSARSSRRFAQRRPSSVRPKQEVVPDGLVGEHAAPLRRKRQPQAGSRVRWNGRDILAVEEHPAGHHRLEADDALQKGALAGAVSADEVTTGAFGTSSDTPRTAWMAP